MLVWKSEKENSMVGLSTFSLAVFAGSLFVRVLGGRMTFLSTSVARSFKSAWMRTIVLDMSGQCQ